MQSAFDTIAGDIKYDPVCVLRRLHEENTQHRSDNDGLNTVFTRLFKAQESIHVYVEDRSLEYLHVLSALKFMGLCGEYNASYCPTSLSYRVR